MKRDLWLSLSNIWQVTLSDSIAWSLDTSNPVNQDQWPMIF